MQCNLLGSLEQNPRQQRPLLVLRPPFFDALYTRAATVTRVHPRCHGDACSRENIDTPTVQTGKQPLLHDSHLDISTMNSLSNNDAIIAYKLLYL